ncbi:MAG: major capsid protein [Cyanobacteria bacterium P01_C01_bin.120]
MPQAGSLLSRDVEQLLPGVLRRRYRPLKFVNNEFQIVPNIPDLEAGTPEVVREVEEEDGPEAVIVADNAADIPDGQEGLTEDRYRTFCIMYAVSYTMQQMRAYEKAGKFDQTLQRKMLKANRKIEEKDNQMAAFGSKAFNVTGFMNNPGVTLDNTNTIDFAAEATTGKQMYEFVLDRLGTIQDSTDETENPNNLLIPPKLMTEWTETTVSTNADKSVYQYLLDNGIASIQTAPECKSAKLEAAGVHNAGTNKDRIVFYPREMQVGLIDAQATGDIVFEVIERHIEPLQMAPEDYHETRKLKYIAPMFKCVTPTIVNYLDSLFYTDIAQVA